MLTTLKVKLARGTILALTVTTAERTTEYSKQEHTTTIQLEQQYGTVEPTHTTMSKTMWLLKFPPSQLPQHAAPVANQIPLSPSSNTTKLGLRMQGLSTLSI